jgi:hypothetical protein
MNATIIVIVELSASLVLRSQVGALGRVGPRTAGQTKITRCHYVDRGREDSDLVDAVPTLACDDGAHDCSLFLGNRTTLRFCNVH